MSKHSEIAYDISNIISLPLAFVRSGYAYTNGGNVYNVEHSLYSWSRVSVSTSSAYDLGVIPTGVYPSNDNNRFYGFPLHCLRMLEGMHEKIV